MSKLTAPLSILGLIYCLLGPLLLFVESRIAGNEALHQALPIAIIATFFFLYTLLSLNLFRHLLAKRSRLMISYYLGSKMLRLIVTATLIVIYALLVKEGILLFAINTFILYIVTAIFSGYYCIREEQRHNHQKE